MTGKRLVQALVALAILTVGSWGLAHLTLGSFATPVALAIAVVKASIVAVVFMELPHASRAAQIAGMVTIFFIALLCAGAVADIGMRDPPGTQVYEGR